MNPITLLNQIEATSSRKEKETLLAQADIRLKYLLVWSMDPYRTYGLKDIPIPTPPADAMALNSEIEDELMGNRLAELGLLLDELNARKLTGNEARDVVNTFLREQTFQTGRWFHRVILKDLSCGMTAKTVNKVFPGLVPSFEVQLADDVNNLKGKAAKLAFPLWGDFKLDGIRMVALKEGSNVTLFTRRGHVVETLPSLAEILGQAKSDFMLDGEVMGRSWNESQSTVFATKNKVDDEAMFFNVFDAMTVEEWKTQTCTHPYMIRREFANWVLQEVSHTRARMVGGKMLNSQTAVDEFYVEALAAGHEGIMLKDPEALYAFKRSRAVMKRKPHATWEGTVVGWTTGEANSKWRGAFGAFQVRFKEGGPITSVGGGFNDEDRLTITQNLTINPEAYNHMIVEVKGQDMTKDGRVRFPVFVRFRNVKDK